MLFFYDDVKPITKESHQPRDDKTISSYRVAQYLVESHHSVTESFTFHRLYHAIIMSRCACAQPVFTSESCASTITQADTP